MSSPFARISYRFGEFEVDTAAYELRRAGRRVRLTGQPLDLLVLLLAHPRELVTYDAMAGALWRDDVFVDREAGIHTAMLKIRQALGDSPDAPIFIETVAGRGYRFVASVDAVSMRNPPAPLSRPVEADSPARTRRHNLAAEVTSFVGRVSELADVTRLLAASRLLSLTGAGGVGKTRLAVRLVSDAGPQFADGVWLIDLASLSTPDLIVQTIAAALGIRENPPRSILDALLDGLRDRHLLLLLDTCEHLIDACAPLVDTLLRAAPGLRVVATSREALGVPGEVVYRVPSLSLPGATPEHASGDAGVHSEATQLFVERAMGVHGQFQPDGDNADPIARICRRLDGIPLAIELAAARVLVLSPQQIEARLQDRFRLLTGGARTAVARQRTLEATIEWSCQLLTDDERLLLSRLSVFPGAWTLAAAEGICAGAGIEPDDMLDLLSRLVSKSLVAVDSDGSSERRYRFLETVRQYARDRLIRIGEAERLRGRHFDFFFAEFGDALATLRGPGQLLCLQRLRLEQENVRAALEWALASPTLTEQGAELAGAMFWYWTKTGQFEEGRRWLERALTVESSARARARVLLGLSHMHYFQGHREDSFDCAAQALSLGRADDAWAASFALFMQALVAYEWGDHPQASARALEALAEADRSGDRIQHGGPLLVLANVTLLAGDYDEAQRLYDDSIRVHREAGDVWGLAILLLAAAGLHLVRRQFSEARAHASEALALCEDLADPRGIAWSLEVFAGLLADNDCAEDAVRLWGASDGLLESVGSPLVPTIKWIRDRHIDPVRHALGDALFATIRAEGRAMPTGRATALARRQVGL